MNTERLLSADEIAQHLGVSLSLVYRLMASGDIPWHRIASCKRVHPADLQTYLERSRVEYARLPKGTKRHF